MRDSHKIIGSKVGRRLRELRGGLKQTEFAGRLGLKQGQYSRYETGERLAPDSVLQRVAGLTGLTPEEVVWGGGKASPSQGDEVVWQVARLAGLLDRGDLEDLRIFLKAKVRDLNRRRRREAEQAEKALAALHKKAQ
jgi:transcriptional regulator with XRE-family HTH domain